MLRFKKLLIYILTIILIVGLIFVGYKYYQFDKDKVYYELSFTCLPIKTGDYAKVEETTQALIKYNQNRDNKTLEKKVKDLIQHFEITDQLAFIKTKDPNFGKMSYSFSEKIKEKEIINDKVRYTFDSMQTVSGLPYLKVTARVAFKPYASYKPAAEIDEKRYLKTAHYWPVKEQYINSIVANITNKDMSRQEKVLAISNWINSNMEPAEEKGTRFGALKAAQTKKGRCMDYSDVFITLCRATGIPTRQVFGRIYQGGGHAWAEVYLKNEGWYPVEPQYKRLGVSKNHIPLFVSSEGNFPVLFWTLPKMERAKGFIDYLFF